MMKWIKTIAAADMLGLGDYMKNERLKPQVSNSMDMITRHPVHMPQVSSFQMEK